MRPQTAAASPATFVEIGNRLIAVKAGLP